MIGGSLWVLRLHHDIAEILLKVALRHHKSNKKSPKEQRINWRVRVMLFNATLVKVTLNTITPSPQIKY
jgi:hypothetical protein